MTTDLTLPTTSAQSRRATAATEAAPPTLFAQGYRCSYQGPRRLTVIGPGESYEVNFGAQWSDQGRAELLDLCAEQLADYAWRVTRLSEARLNLGFRIPTWSLGDAMEYQSRAIDNARNALENLLENERTGRTNGDGLCDFHAPVPYVAPVFVVEVRG